MSTTLQGFATGMVEQIKSSKIHIVLFTGVHVH